MSAENCPDPVLSLELKGALGPAERFERARDGLNELLSYDCNALRRKLLGDRRKVHSNHERAECLPPAAEVYREYSASRRSAK